MHHIIRFRFTLRSSLVSNVLNNLNSSAMDSWISTFVVRFFYLLRIGRKTGFPATCVCRDGGACTGFVCQTIVCSTDRLWIAWVFTLVVLRTLSWFLRETSPASGYNQLI